MDTAVAGGFRLTGLRDVTDDLTALDAPGHGRWAVVLPFDGPPVCARFDVSVPDAGPRSTATGLVPAGAWTSSLDRDGFGKGVGAVRDSIRTATCTRSTSAGG